SMMAFHNKRTDEETRMSNPNWMMTSMTDGQNEARHDSRILQYGRGAHIGKYLTQAKACPDTAF
ncbi:MAG: hypothetical protein J4G04_07575, partial [Nitrosopumilaceae archaeon]|nr:hypothetical protein [Nitrosopumilaceae archaeon]